MSPELEGRIKTQKAEEMVQEANPISVIITLQQDSKFSGTLDRLVIQPGKFKLTVMMLIDEAVGFMSQIWSHGSNGDIKSIDVINDMHDFNLSDGCKLNKAVIKNIDHLAGVCHVFIDIA